MPWPKGSLREASPSPAWPRSSASLFLRSWGKPPSRWAENHFAFSPMFLTFAFLDAESTSKGRTHWLRIVPDETQDNIQQWPSQRAFALPARWRFRKSDYFGQLDGNLCNWSLSHFRQQTKTLREIRTTRSTVPDNIFQDESNFFTIKCAQFFKSDWTTVTYKYSAYSGSYLSLPK